MSSDEILTVSDLASLLKIAEKTVYNLAQRGAVPGFKVGGQWRFSRHAVNQWIEARGEVSKPRSRGGVTLTGEVAESPSRSEAKLQEIVRRLVHAYEPDSIYLFGSHARGDVHGDSDYDLMVLVPTSSSEEQRRSRLAYEVLRGTGVAADVLVWTTQSFASRQHLKASLPATILREGRRLYAS